MDNSQSRKEFLSSLSKYAAGITAGFADFDLFTRKDKHSGNEKYKWPWRYKPVDPEKVRIRTHDYCINVKLLNNESKGAFKPKYGQSKKTTGCLECHGNSEEANVLSKMDCVQCHGENPHK